MKRILRFNDGIIEGVYVDFIVKLYPHLATNFTQRKQYDEYYYKVGEIELTINDLDLLSNEFLKVIVTCSDIELVMIWDI